MVAEGIIIIYATFLPATGLLALAALPPSLLDSATVGAVLFSLPEPPHPIKETLTIAPTNKVLTNFLIFLIDPPLFTKI